MKWIKLIPGGWGRVSGAKKFKEMYEVKLEFPGRGGEGVGGVLEKIFSVGEGGMDLFSGQAISTWIQFV